MLTASDSPLADDYYLQNFHQLTSFVAETYRDILSPEERDWYQRVESATRPAQQLYVRLLTRKGSVFRLDKLNYPEIEDIAAAAAELAAIGLTDAHPPEDLARLLPAFTKPELLRYLGEPADRGRSRAELVSHWLSLDASACAELALRLQDKASWLTVMGHQYWTLYRLCFFGNLYQDASEFVLQQLGTVQYEAYALPRQARAFHSRQQLEAHLRYFECEALMQTIDRRNVPALDELVQKLPETIAGDAHLRRRVDRFRNTVARQMERLGAAEPAMALYAQSVHPPARERRIRWLLSENRLESAEHLLQSLLNEPFNEAERQTGQRLQRQLLRKQGRSSRTLSRFRPASTVLTLEPAGRRVELEARAFYSRFGDCHYTENVLVCGVLGLFIWDIIFQPVPGAFFNPFQAAPADFRQPEFRIRRVRELSARLQELDGGVAFAERVLHNLVARRGIANPLVRWARLDDTLVARAVASIPAGHWRALFERLLSDLHENTAGLPDLILFRDDGSYELIEIKGPGDSLQQNQIRWMQYFDQHRIPCRVVHVRWAQPVLGEA